MLMMMLMVIVMAVAAAKTALMMMMMVMLDVMLTVATAMTTSGRQVAIRRFKCYAHCTVGASHGKRLDIVPSLPVLRSLPLNDESMVR